MTNLLLLLKELMLLLLLQVLLLRWRHCDDTYSIESSKD
jgi:hypothetical protein